LFEHIARKLQGGKMVNSLAELMLALSEMMLSLRENLTTLIVLVSILLIINIILWVYVVKNKKRLSEIDDRLKKIHYIVADVSEKIKH